jgi:hypothetical protein
VNHLELIYFKSGQFRTFFYLKLGHLEPESPKTGTPKVEPFKKAGIA